MILIRMGYPADPAVVMVTSASYEEVERVVAAYARVTEEQGWHEDILQDHLRKALPSVKLDVFTIRGYYGDDVKREVLE